MSIVTKFVIWTVVLIALVGYAGLRALWNNQYTTTPDFIYWQTMYKSVAADLAATAELREKVLVLPIAVNQETVQQFPFIVQADGTTQQRVDRCVSCHDGLDNPAMTAEKIIKDVSPHHDVVAAAQVPGYLSTHPSIRDIVYVIGAHPGKGAHLTSGGSIPWPVVTDTNGSPADAAKQKFDARLMLLHPFATFGCTTCHDGSGRELVYNNAHGHSEFWLKPLLPARYQQADCAQCHERFNPKTFAAEYLPEMTTIARGQQLFKENACWGCHKIEGFSKGNVGPELTEEGRIVNYQTIEHQLWDPRYKTNNCVMPYFFSQRIIIAQAGQLVDGKPAVGGEQVYQDALGNLHSIANLPPADISPTVATSPDLVAVSDTRTTLEERGYVPDGTRQADVDALVTFVLAQTGLNYTQDTSGRFARLAAYNGANPPTVPATVAEGKLLFTQSGCYACHYLGDPNNVKNGHGGVAGPNLTWEGSRHSRQWEVAHYLNPQLLVPKSIMPVFPFSDSQRDASSLYDTSFLPKGTKPVSPDQDLPTTAMQNTDIVVPQVRYMSR